MIKPEPLADTAQWDASSQQNKTVSYMQPSNPAIFSYVVYDIGKLKREREIKLFSRRSAARVSAGIQFSPAGSGNPHHQATSPSHITKPHRQATWLLWCCPRSVLKQR